jgi:hypothetical protein
MLAAISALAGLPSLGFWLLGQPAIAQDAAQAVYIVTYVEVAPNAAAEGRKLFLGYVKDARKASGAVQIDAVQRISDGGHFALIEQWQSLATNSARPSIPCKVLRMTSVFTPPFRWAPRSRFRAMGS